MGNLFFKVLPRVSGELSDKFCSGKANLVLGKLIRDFFRESIVQKLSARKPCSGILFFDRKNGRNILSKLSTRKLFSGNLLFHRKFVGKLFFKVLPRVSGELSDKLFSGKANRVLGKLMRDFSRESIVQKHAPETYFSTGKTVGIYFPKHSARKPCSGNLLCDRKFVGNLFFKVLPGVSGELSDKLFSGKANRVLGKLIRDFFRESIVRNTGGCPRFGILI